MNRAWLVDITDRPMAVDFEQAETAELDLRELENAPRDPAQFMPLPSPAADAKSYKPWQRGWEDHLYRTRRYSIWYSPSLEEYSLPAESERDFRIRLMDRAREQRDEQVARLREDYQKKIDKLEERLRKAELALTREQEQASGRALAKRAHGRIGRPLRPAGTTPHQFHDARPSRFGRPRFPPRFGSGDRCA